jgi:aminomethyltransferase
MVEFAGWNMPVQYSGVIDEHNAVRERAGLFDVSHMGEVSVRGPEALPFLQHVTCNNVARLEAGRAQYTGLMLPNGAFVDDLLVYMRDVDDYLLVINAANTPKDVAWLREHGGGRDLDLRDVSDEWAQVALQGPEAEAILQQLVDAPLDPIRYYGFIEVGVAGQPSIVSRTGYTGEDGFEIYAPAASGTAIWDAILSAGESRGVQPIGLAARDTLRLEARMALYGNDIDETTTALEAGLGWIVKFKKGDFIGRDALLLQREAGVQRKLVGFEIRGRGIARPGYAALTDGKAIGRVTSGTFAPYLKKNIGLAYLPSELSAPGVAFQIEIRGRSEDAEVVPTPFYKRED